MIRPDLAQRVRARTKVAASELSARPTRAADTTSPKLPPESLSVYASGGGGAKWGCRPALPGSSWTMERSPAMARPVGARASVSDTNPAPSSPGSFTVMASEPPHQQNGVDFSVARHHDELTLGGLARARPCIEQC